MKVEEAEVRNTGRSGLCQLESDLVMGRVLAWVGMKINMGLVKYDSRKNSGPEELDEVMAMVRVLALDMVHRMGTSKAGWA